MTIYSIYKFTNLVNGKIYIGKSINPEKRKASHIKAAEKGSNCIFHNAIRKYGIVNFSFEVIDASATNKYEHNILERYFISDYACCLLDGPDNGYNMTRGGDGGSTVTSEVARTRNLARLKSGDHPFIGEHGSKMATARELAKVANGTHPFAGAAGTKMQLDRVANGTNPWAGELGSAHSTKMANDRIAKGTHNWTGEALKQDTVARMNAGTHPSQQKHICPRCGKHGLGNPMIGHINRCIK